MLTCWNVIFAGGEEMEEMLDVKRRQGAFGSSDTRLYSEILSEEEPAFTESIRDILVSSNAHPGCCGWYVN